MNNIRIFLFWARMLPALPVACVATIIWFCTDILFLGGKISSIDLVVFPLIWFFTEIAVENTTVQYLLVRDNRDRAITILKKLGFRLRGDLNGELIFWKKRKRLGLYIAKLKEQEEYLALEVPIQMENAFNEVVEQEMLI